MRRRFHESDDTGSRQYCVTGATKAAKASHEINDSEEYYIGRAVAARVLSQYPLYQDAKVTEYVNEVGQTVARKSARPNTFKGYHFAVLDTNETQCLCLSRGHHLHHPGPAGHLRQ